MIKYLFSAVDKINGFNVKQEEYLKKDIKNNSSMVFIASTFDNYEKNDIYKNKMIEFFSNIGITFNKLSLIDNRTSKEEAITLLKETDYVFLLGGDTFNQMKSINDYNLKKYIQKVDIVLGVSAGSLNQSKKVIYLDEYQDNKIVNYDGLDLVDFNIYPHADINNADYLKELFLVSEYISLIALPNDSFIRVEKEIEFIGDYYKISKNK